MAIIRYWEKVRNLTTMNEWHDKFLMINDECWDQIAAISRDGNTEIRGGSSNSWILRIPRCPRKTDSLTYYAALSVGGQGHEVSISYKSRCAVYRYQKNTAALTAMITVVFRYLGIPSCVNTLAHRVTEHNCYVLFCFLRTFVQLTY